MVELGVAGVAPLPLRRGRPLPEGALALGGGLTPGAFSPPPGPLGFSAAPIATTRSFTSLSRASLSGSPASCSRATRIWSFVIRLPSSGIRAIRSLTRSARTGIRANSGKAGAKRKQNQGLGTGAEPGWPHDALAGMPWRVCLGGHEKGQSPREGPRLGLLVPIHLASLCPNLRRSTAGQRQTHGDLHPDDGVTMHHLHSFALQPPAASCASTASGCGPRACGQSRSGCLC
jgi:hypothetical protein